MIVEKIMSPDFKSLHPKQTLDDAINAFKSASESKGTNVFGMMVTDSNDQLVGMLSMYDILRFIQPKNISLLGELDGFNIDPMFTGLRDQIKKIYVEDIMATSMITVKPETHLLVVVDIMVKKHIRRLPVIDKNVVVGMVYRYDVFHHLMNMFTE